MKNEVLATLVELQKQGVNIHLTEEGWNEFVRLIQAEGQEIPTGWDVAG